MQPLDHLWEMMKTTSRLVLGFFFCIAVSAEENIVVLKNDTENIIEYVQNDNEKEKNEFKFWELLQKN